MLKLIGPSFVPAALAVLAVSASAQTGCVATTRELSALTPRDRAAELSFPGRPDRDVIADAATCAMRPDIVPRLTIFGESIPAQVSLQPLVARVDFQGGVADPRDDGAAWTGRGTNLFFQTGFALDVRWFHAVVAPQLWYAQNRAFDVFTGSDTTRSDFASPLYVYGNSIDLPPRFGADPIVTLGLGQTAAWATAGGADFGASASSQKWGPGERGTLLLGADAPGIPRLFVRTNKPVRSPIGLFSGTVFTGTLTESRFFTKNDDGQLRTITALNLAWTPNDSNTFIAGVAHQSMQLGSRFADRQSQPLRGPVDQMTEVYGQYRDPRSGIRFYGEVGSASSLSIRRLFTVPYQGLVYLVGFDRGIRTRHGMLLLTAEVADLEQYTDVRGEGTHDFYTGSVIPQGWTQRGQLLGYSTGPGSQSQWIAGDWIASRWSLGVFAERVRWNEDAFIREYLPYPNRHDGTLRGGVRAGVVWRGNEVAVEGSIGHRLNYQFQNDTFLPNYRTVDVSVPALRLVFTPAVNIR